MVARMHVAGRGAPAHWLAVNNSSHGRLANLEIAAKYGEGKRSIHSSCSALSLGRPRSTPLCLRFEPTSLFHGQFDNTNVPISSLPIACY
jgi:hypothetical protein